MQLYLNSAVSLKLGCPYFVSPLSKIYQKQRTRVHNFLWSATAAPRYMPRFNQWYNCCDEHGGPESVSWAFFRHENQVGRERYA